MATRTLGSSALQALAILSTWIAGCRAGAEGPVVPGDAVLDARAIEFATGEVDERWRPALALLADAVQEGRDGEARRILEGLALMGPEGRAREIAEAFERVLAGRAALRSIELRLECAYEKDAGHAGFARVTLAATTSGPDEILLRPGPAILRCVSATIGPGGSESRGVEIFPLGNVEPIALGPERPFRREIGLVPAARARTALAQRLVLDIEVCAGELVTGGRTLPARTIRVSSAEIVLLATEMAAKGLATPAELARVALDGNPSRRSALDVAVRIPPAERAAALDALSAVLDRLGEPALAELSPALAWLAPDEQSGEDPLRWRAFLRRWGSARDADLDLKLPRRAAPRTAGS